ncbi:YqhV family protein [Carboxydochorda subterranea]|uniref:YqhV family protein n=1 Tax=Carboxydichorda subterranea TaxID=3109565 RepID=A0ABZ1BWY4_9FIRM|nr:YqhV family protein [Limnochorda sp. L945t]WRP17130.1 YqhV family protein [Limnochorda sp. L945t]
MPEERIVSGMALLRLLSATIEIMAAVLMVRSGRVADAMRINGLLGVVGPLVLASVTAIGLAGLAGKLSPLRMGTLAVAVALILATLWQR